jgi:hypothetical protein
MSEEGREFEVRDRRRLMAEEGGPAASAGAGEAAREDAPGGGDESGAHSGEAAPIDFVSFIGSLAATAFLHMGEKLAPGQPEMPVDLPAARQMIDLLDLLKQKTKGNLEKEEADALEALLYNLRLRYVALSSGRRTP